MRKIAVVFGFSETCIELARQCIASCWEAFKLCHDIDLSFYCYECNYDIQTRKPKQFKKIMDISSQVPISNQIIQRNSVNISWASPLPDISIYDDFARSDLHDFDGALFCHDDIYLHKYPVFDKMFSILDNPNFNLVAEVGVACLKDVSLRFRPSFIFVKTNKFLQSNLSFVNSYPLFAEGIKNYPVNHDGGAGLFASYYHKNNKSQAVPFVNFQGWFEHLRLDADYGIEMYNIFSPDSYNVKQILKKAQKYADHVLYNDGSRVLQNDNS